MTTAEKLDFLVTYMGNLQMNHTMNSNSFSSSPSPFLLTPNAMTAPSADVWPPADGLALQTAYTPDPFQQHAIVGIHRGDHVFVTAKTGSGKTFVGEYLIAYMLAKGKRVFYTTPPTPSRETAAVVPTCSVTVPRL